MSCHHRGGSLCASAFTDRRPCGVPEVRGGRGLCARAASQLDRHSRCRRGSVDKRKSTTMLCRLVRGPPIRCAGVICCRAMLTPAVSPFPPIRGVVGGLWATKEHSVRAFADACSRDLACRTSHAVRRTTQKPVCKKLAPFKRSMFLQFTDCLAPPPSSSRRV